MIRIRQHGHAGDLFDLNAFFEDVAAFCKVEQWQIRVQECLGEGAPEFEAHMGRIDGVYGKQGT